MTITENRPASRRVPGQSFAALRHKGFRAFCGGTAAAMMADNAEHVISYWVIFRKFDSPALGGFAIISHWLPYLLISVYTGALADRLDPRRIIQLGMAIFMAVSLSWGLLFLSDGLQMWHAMALLTMHGMAGVLWLPASQLLLHDIVPREQLQSAVRLNSSGRYLGMLLGPAMGSGLLLALGPARGMFVNALIYLPLALWLWKAPYGPRFRSAPATPADANRGFADLLQTWRAIMGDSSILSMTLLAGAAAFFIGNSYHAQMPAFAQWLKHGDPGITYGALLAADAAGALTAGIVLESRGLLTPRPAVALMLGMGWCVALLVFAVTPLYAVALPVLFAAGFMELSFNSMAQTLVQLNAPVSLRGRIIGVYSMASFGMRTFSGITIGILGAAVGIHWSLALSAVTLCAVLVAILTRVGRGGVARGP